MRSGSLGTAYLALPDGAGPHPGIVVVHEAFGLNDNIRGICRRFAAEGYAALGVDLFEGWGGWPTIRGWTRHGSAPSGSAWAAPSF
jgi:dienelactone hydrolase